MAMATIATILALTFPCGPARYTQRGSRFAQPLGQWVLRDHAAEVTLPREAGDVPRDLRYGGLGVDHVGDRLLARRGGRVFIPSPGAVVPPHVVSPSPSDYNRRCDTCGLDASGHCDWCVRSMAF